MCQCYCYGHNLESTPVKLNWEWRSRRNHLKYPRTIYASEWETVKYWSQISVKLDLQFT